LIGQSAGATWKLVDVNLAQRELRWSVDIATNGGAHIPLFNDVRLFGAEGIVVGMDNSILYLVSARKGSNWGVAAMDVQTRSVVRFASTGLLLGAPAVLRHSGESSRDTLVAIAAVAPDDPKFSDSALVIEMAPEPRILGAIHAPQGSSHIENLAAGVSSRLYVVGDRTVGTYDVLQAAYTAIQQRPPHGRGVPSSTGAYLGFTDAGSPDVIPVGEVRVFDASLHGVGQVDLRSYSQSGSPPVVTDIAFSNDDASILIAAGSPAVRPGPQPGQTGRLLLANWRSGAVSKLVELSSYGYPRVVLLP
jgi:hypothetical protein